MNDLIIKPITAEDLDEFYALFSTLVQSQFLEYSEKTREAILQKEHMWTKENYRKSLHNPRKILLGARKDGKLIGLVDGDNLVGGIAMCSWLMVDPSYQRKGVGKQLLATFSEIAKGTGCHMMYLFSSKHNNLYYEKMGFKQIGVFEKGWFGNRDFIFAKDLQEPREENFLR